MTFFVSSWVTSSSKVARQEPSSVALQPHLRLRFRLLPYILNAVGVVVGPTTESGEEVAVVLKDPLEDVVVAPAFASAAVELLPHCAAYSNLFVDADYSCVNASVDTA